nr:reverse transcriptase domain-containing protein [Escherichia coli]
METRAAYCRYADDFVLIVKGTKAQAEAIRESVGVLEGSLKLRLNMDKTKITHVNDGFIFLGQSDHSQTQSLWRDASGLNDPGESQKTSPHR